jgi:D-alanyl-D-alanine carboxypeptidase/D-alanyl-D-alanine-endopeptidase (penicillin-binding protein 4)
MRVAIVAFGLALALVGPGAALAAGDESLRAALDASLSVRALRGARVAALVVARESGEVLYTRNPDRLLIPASNLKILTAVAAFSAFGPTHRFVTTVLSDAKPDAEGNVGALYVRGGGDPALTSEDYWRLAADLRRLGLRRIRGALVLDDSAFDGARWHPSWGAVSARAYHAPVGALTVNYGAFAVTVEAGPVQGSPVQARIDPRVAIFRLTNRARTGASRVRRSLVVDRRAGSGVEQVVVSGVEPAGRDPKTYHRSVVDPARYAGAVLRMQLEAVGIEVEGETRIGYAPAEAALLLEFSGHPLAEVVRRFLKYSNNSIGEALVKSMGARESGGPGGWPQGVAAVRTQLDALGVRTQALVQVDGSGLSYENRATPRIFVDALRLGAGSFRFGPEFLAALPIAAADGTLEERATDSAGRARAKTGLLTRVTGLSGLAEGPEGGVVAFSVLVNGFRGSAEAAMDAVDGFLEVLTSGNQDRLAVRP